MRTRRVSRRPGRRGSKTRRRLRAGRRPRPAVPVSDRSVGVRSCRGPGCGASCSWRMRATSRCRPAPRSSCAGVTELAAAAYRERAGAHGAARARRGAGRPSAVGDARQPRGAAGRERSPTVTRRRRDELLHADHASMLRYDQTARSELPPRRGHAFPVGTRLSLGGRNMTTLVFQSRTAAPDRGLRPCLSVRPPRVPTSWAYARFGRRCRIVSRASLWRHVSWRVRAASAAVRRRGAGCARLRRAEPPTSDRERGRRGAMELSRVRPRNSRPCDEWRRSWPRQRRATCWPRSLRRPGGVAGAADLHGEMSRMTGPGGDPRSRCQDDAPRCLHARPESAPG